MKTSIKNFLVLLIFLSTSKFIIAQNKLDLNLSGSLSSSYLESGNSEFENINKAGNLSITPKYALMPNTAIGGSFMWNAVPTETTLINNGFSYTFNIDQKIEKFKLNLKLGKVKGSDNGYEFSIKRELYKSFEANFKCSHISKYNADRPSAFNNDSFSLGLDYKVSLKKDSDSSLTLRGAFGFINNDGKRKLIKECKANINFGDVNLAAKWSNDITIIESPSTLQFSIGFNFNKEYVW